MNRRNFTYIKIACNLSIFIVSLLLVIFFLPKLLMFFMPFVVAWIIAWIATPIVRFVERHLRLKRKTSMVFVVVAIISGVIAVIYNVAIYLGRLVVSFLADLPQMWESIRMEAHGMFQILFNLLDKLPGEGTTALEDFLSNSGDYVGELMSSLSAPTISAVGSIASKVPDIIIFTIMCLIATYFFVVEREMIFQKVYDITPKGIRDVWTLVKKCVVESIGGYFKAQFKIEIWIYLLIFIGLTILNVKYAIIIALGIAILDLLPVFGTGAVLWPWTLIKFINGDYFSAIGLLLIWGISQLVRQFIQPKYVGDTLGVHPIPTLFLLFAGYKLSGVFGMIVAVPLGILASTLYKEGVFKTTEQSLILLIGRINEFRRFDEKELEEMKSYQTKSEE
ncbi:MAG: sporulation integral membrane protein YtvI [Lachnospiraceae bacterium]|nr:sporulation integral membrane protein YtvI [Lachnospiraceae bacterium]